MKGTFVVSAPESKNMTTRFLESIICPRVGHALCFTGREGGINARSAIPEVLNAGAHMSVMESPSGLVKIRVRT